MNAADLPRIFKGRFSSHAAAVAWSVVIDIPKDVQQAKIQRFSRLR